MAVRINMAEMIAKGRNRFFSDEINHKNGRNKIETGTKTGILMKKFTDESIRKVNNNA
jgi:hypothetical protein